VALPLAEALSNDSGLSQSALEVIGRYVSLRRAGREYSGCCPFHDDKHPSFSFNEQKGLFYCFGCQASGDVIDFIRLIENCSFREALSILGLAPGARAVPSPKRRAAEKVVRWVNHQRANLNDKIRELDEDIRLADELGRH
jgi:DNA primase